MSERIRVLICDDHPIVRQGLRTFLGSRPDIEIVGEAGDGEAALRKVPHAHPDVVLMDLVMPGLDGVEATRRIRAEHPDVRVLVLTSVTDDELVLPAVRAGASGYLLKDSEPDDLEEAIRVVHRGQSWLHPGAAARVLDAVTSVSDPVQDALAGLTPREREVLELLTQGSTNRQIGRALGVTEKTVKTHVGNLLAKLGVADRTQAAVLAVRAGIGAQS